MVGLFAVNQSASLRVLLILHTGQIIFFANWKILPLKFYINPILEGSAAPLGNPPKGGKFPNRLVPNVTAIKNESIS